MLPMRLPRFLSRSCLFLPVAAVFDCSLREPVGYRPDFLRSELQAGYHSTSVSAKSRRVPQSSDMAALSQTKPLDLASAT
jgi:hypothetical protein